MIATDEIKNMGNVHGNAGLFPTEQNFNFEGGDRIGFVIIRLREFQGRQQFHEQPVAMDPLSVDHAERIVGFAGMRCLRPGCRCV